LFSTALGTLGNVEHPHDHDGSKTRPLASDLHEDPQPLSDAPIVDDDEDVLPFLRMKPRNFERLNLAVAERADGLRDAVEFGHAGDNQEGVDFVGRLPSGDYAGYQVRRLKRKPTRNTVRNAVNDFLAARPLNASRFVLCTARFAGSPDVIKEVQSLRESNPELDIQVRGAERLSVILADQPDLVQRFFNQQYRERFCGRLPTAPPVLPGHGEPSVEALLRGPIKALKLERSLADAEATTEPRQRAAAYRELSRALAAGPYRAFARKMTEREADALREAGDIDGACDAWLEVGAQLAETGLMPPASPALSRAREIIESASPGLRARLQAVEALHSWHDDSTGGLKALRHALDDLRSLGDGWTRRVALWWAESALVDEHLDELTAAANDLKACADKGPEDQLWVRIQLVVADATGDWAAITRAARVGLLAPADAGLVFARYGRWFAWSGDPSGAMDAYRQALSPLMGENLQGDARSALESIARVLMIYGPISELRTTTDLIPMIVAGRTRFGEVYDARRATLQALHDQDWPQAQAEARRFLWEARIGGHLEDELGARNWLGDLYSRVGEFAAACGNYTLAGTAEKAVAASGHLAEPVDVLADLRSPAPWVVAAALAVIAADGDKSSPQEAAALAPLVLSLVHGRRQSPLGPQVWQQAFEALGGLALQLPQDIARAAVDLVEPLIRRGPVEARPIDGDLLAILAGIYDTHPLLAARAGEALATALCESGLSDTVTPMLSDRIGRDMQLRVMLEERAGQGDIRATRVLAFAGIESPTTMAYAAEKAAAFLARPAHDDPTEVSLTTGHDRLGGLARFLDVDQRKAVAKHLLAHARSTLDLEVNRASAAFGLCALVDCLPDEDRDELFTATLQLADPSVELSHFDALFKETKHPLSRFRMTLGAGHLHRSAVLAAARCARTAEQVAVIQPYLDQLLRSKEGADLHAAARLLLVIEPLVGQPVDIETLANHESRHLRSVAAWLLTHGSAKNPTLCRRLTRDPDRSVRLAMADSLEDFALHDEELAAELRALLQADPSALVRTRTALS
jgi:tetratricopeptide (TPR) repeat protein